MTPQRLQHRRQVRAEKKRRYESTRTLATEYNELLTARAKARNYRILFPDVVKGMSAIEEAVDFTPRSASAISRMSASNDTPQVSAPSAAIRRKVVQEDPAPVATVEDPPSAEDLPPQETPEEKF